MVKLLALVAVMAVSGCATCGDDPDPAVRCGYASENGAAFLGYHGPVYRVPMHMPN